MLKNIYKKYGYLILIAYLISAYFYMPLGLVAIICMMSPIIFALMGKGRYWCGNFCPRGLFFQNVTCGLSRKKPIPKFLTSNFFRVFLICFIMSNFGYGIYKNWGNIAGIGMVFYRIIIITTIFGVIINALYMPRTWCAFCPMGSLSYYITCLKKKSGNNAPLSNGNEMN